MASHPLGSRDEMGALDRGDGSRAQFGNGKLVEYKKQFSNETGRALSRQFLEDLLSTTNYAVHRHGVRISHGLHPGSPSWCGRLLETERATPVGDY